MVNNSLTEKQEQILDFIKSEIAQKGYPPTVREICKGVGLKSISAVHAHLNILEKNGYIQKEQMKPRAIHVMNDIEDDEIVSIPVIKQIKKDPSILDINNITSYFPMSADMVPAAGKYFAYKVKDDDEVEGINAGEIVFVKNSNSIKNRSKVIAIADDKLIVGTIDKKANDCFIYQENGKKYAKNEYYLLGRIFGVCNLNYLEI